MRIFLPVNAFCVNLISLLTVPQPAPVTHTYLAPPLESSDQSEEQEAGARSLQERALDFESVERRAIERFMWEQFRKNGEVVSGRSGPGMFAFFDK